MIEFFKYLIWFICGFIASYVYCKKYKPENDKKINYIGIEAIVFIWGWVGLFLILLRLLLDKIYKK